MTYRVLIADDEANYRKLFAMMVVDLDVTVLEVGDGEEALAALDRDEVDLVVTDLNMPKMDGMALLKDLVGRPSAPPVVVVTAYGSIDSAVEAMRLGAIDYLQKPFDAERLHLTLARAFRVTDLIAENRRLRAAVEGTYDFSQIVGESPAIVAALKTAGKVAATDSTVLIRGESGTGKELVARAIHFNSRRKSGPLVAVNCAALPETLLEAELFGAEAGAYTGAVKRRRGRVEQAKGGTLFLDEIGDMPLPIQAKLLRLLQERTFVPLGGEAELTADVRFLLATNRNLEALMAAKSFREDLFYRVAVVPVTLPPLRDRGNDVLMLAEVFVHKFCAATGRKPMALTAAARTVLRAYPFPGNVRELANTLERAVILSEGDALNAADLQLGVVASGEPEASRPAGAAQRVELPKAGLVLEDVERELILQALSRAEGNKSRAAKLLGLSRATLRYRVEKLGIDVGKEPDGDDS
jgi:two-component system, NtrC family, response regulator AtoC